MEQLFICMAWVAALKALPALGWHNELARAGLVELLSEVLQCRLGTAICLLSSSCHEVLSLDGGLLLMKFTELNGEAFSQTVRLIGPLLVLASQHIVHKLRNKRKKLDEMELPDATALYPAVCHHMRRLNPSNSPVFSAIAAPYIKNAQKRFPAVNGRGTERINVLAPYVARLFASMMEKVEISTCWKEAKMTPYKKGSLLDPANYRMLTVSDIMIMYRMYAKVLRDVVTGWCRDKNKIPDTQYACSTGSAPSCISQLHAAFIDSKQAYDAIPREALWAHLQCICIPTCLLAILKNIYDNDEYALIDAYKQAREELMIHMSKSEVVHFDSKGNNVPPFTLGGAQIARAESLKYLDMLFTKHINSFSSSGHMCTPFLSGCRCVRQLACDYKLADLPHTMLWLTKAYALPASYPWRKAQCTQLLSDFIMPRSPAIAQLPARNRHRSVWPTEDQAEHGGHTNKVAIQA
eukprot:1159415-Pelagomonas_calceolata.AAC.6